MDAVSNRLSWRRLPWLAELGSIAFFYGVYMVVRVLSPHRETAADYNALDIMRVERWLGLPSELGLNQWLSERRHWELIFSWYYVTLHYLVTVFVLVWLFHRRRRFYAPLRSALVIASASALVVYAAWPLAPPRYAMSGAVDTVQDVLHQGHGVSGLVNDIAAMPSMHVGWALWCAVVVVSVLDTPWRHAAWLYPVATTMVVVATANHYLLDAAGGVLIVAVGLGLCGVRPRHLVKNLAPRTVPQPVTERCAA